MSFVASQPEPARFDTLGNLPGGVGQYMRVVKDVCDYVCHNADANLAGVARTVAKERPVAPKSMESYLGTLGRTVIVRHIDDRITLTPLGKQIAQAPTCDERSRLMADALVQRCTGMAQLLALYDNEASNDLSLKDIQAGLGSRFSNWKEATNYKIRNYWLVELRCVVATRSRHNAITPLGRDVLHYNFPDTHALLAVETNADPIDDELDQTSIIDESEDMLDELQAASVASNNYRRLQEAVGVCFRFVGGEVELRGEPGVAGPDLIVIVRLPGRVYRIVIDTKARASGHLADLNVQTLVEYKKQCQADYVVVVAGSFADGKIVRHAEELGVLLLTVDALSDLVRLHATTPLSLDDYEAIFKVAGLVESLPESILSAATRQNYWNELMSRLVYYLQESSRKEADLLLSAQDLAILLFAKEERMRFSAEDIQVMINLLRSPPLNWLHSTEDGKVCLRMTPDTLRRRLRRLSDQFEEWFEVLQGADR